MFTILLVLGMNPKLLILLVIFLLSFNLGCRKQSATLPEIVDGEHLMTITFGSCNKQDQEQRLWDDILNEEPDTWIWLGDNVYGDTNDPAVMKTKYDRQKSDKNYQKLQAKASIYGVWDDHDYGANDAGKKYPKKAEMRDLMFEFLDVPSENDAWEREGAYQTYDLRKNGLKVKLILLDSRYFRDDPIKSENTYLPNLEGTILGEAQWLWLEKQVTNSDADIHLIGNGIQVISAEHRFEKWNNFPKERDKLLHLIKKYQLKNTILLSGDRHLSELSKIEIDGLSQFIYDVTSSGMTHSYTTYSGEPNQYRIGQVVFSKSYAVLKVFRSSSNRLDIRLEFKGDGGKVFQSFDLF